MGKAPKNEPKARPQVMDAEVGVNLRRLREAAGWTQDALSEKMDVSKGLVSLLESGERAFNSSTLTSAARSFGLHPKVLFGGVEFDQAVAMLKALHVQVDRKRELTDRKSGKTAE